MVPNPIDTAAADRALLRRFEPVIRYTRGEHFFPMRVNDYVRECSLWVQCPNQPSQCLVPEGELTLEKLAQPRAHHPEAIYYLKFIEPLNIAELAGYAFRESLTHKPAREVFHAGQGRLGRVGYGSRFVDALFSITLLARGRVPGDTAAAAALTYQKIMQTQEYYSYSGRVVRHAGWIALQYWFFYPFNNWRSGFFGVNDHEADWEMIYIYLSEAPGGEIQPEWAAYASHDFQGDDLRRRWDDPELEKVGEHPVIYAGAGSHASYYSPGEYLTEVELPFLSPLVRLVDRLQALGKKIMRWSQPEDAAGLTFNVFRIPFVDYARGDGWTIGAGGDQAWSEPELLDPPPDWAIHYRGLWGLYARDPISGENAPAGPIYNRDGTTRRSWHDPLGWAGLDKVPPPHARLALLEAQRQQIGARCAERAQVIQQKRQALLALGVEIDAMQSQPHLKKLRLAHQQASATLSKELNQLCATQTAEEALREALAQHQAGWQAGERGPARAHLHRAHQPAPPESKHLGRLAEVWAAISIGLMMICFVVLVLFAHDYLIFGLTALIAAVLFVEAGFRRQLSQLIISLTNALAIGAALILLFDFFWEIVILAVLVAGGYIMWENLRELRS